MSFTTENTAIRSKFDGWVASRIKWPGTPFQEPSVAWIAVNILRGAGNELTIGTPAQRRFAGVVAIQIFDRENNGLATILSLADQLEQRFINANSRTTISATEYIDFQQPGLTPDQVVNGWRQVNLNVPYVRDEFK